MQGISKVAMGSALVVALCLVSVFILLVLLYVELCCSLLRQRRPQTSLPTTATSGGGASFKLQNKSPGEEAATPSMNGWKGVPGSPLQKPVSTPSSAAAFGVLRAPASFFFSAVHHGVTPAALTKQGETSLHFIGLISSPCSASRGDSAGGGSSPGEHFVCISNPIYDGACSSSHVGAGDGSVGDGSTPFETPDTSPSRLEVDDDEGEGSPALTPMKKLPPFLPLATPAAFLADGRRSLATSVSATDTGRHFSSSSSNSPCTSPSW